MQTQPRMLCFFTISATLATAVAEVWNAPPHEETELLGRLEELWDSGDDANLQECIDLIATYGGTNSIASLLPHLEYNPAIAMAEKAGPGAVVTTTGYRFVVADAIKKIGLPLEQCLEQLSCEEPFSIRETLLADIGLRCHASSMVSQVVARAETDGGRWLHVEHLCIGQVTVATNAAWPISVTLSRTQDVLSVAVTNYLASPLSIPGEPMSLSRNTLRLLTDIRYPLRYREYGTMYDPALDNRPEDCFLSIPAHGSTTFSVTWADATNGIPTDVWEQAWAVQWALRDDMHHVFLSNPVPLSSP